MDADERDAVVERMEELHDEYGEDIEPPVGSAFTLSRTSEVQLNYRSDATDPALNGYELMLSFPGRSISVPVSRDTAEKLLDEIGEWHEDVFFGPAEDEVESDV